MLKGAREQSGLTQAVVAKRIGKAQSFVSNYESGERRLDLVEFITVASILGIDPLHPMKKLIRLMSR
jgi:transcriptional regulator with XRE-family HTH domain